MRLSLARAAHRVDQSRERRAAIHRYRRIACVSLVEDRNTARRGC